VLHLLTADLRRGTALNPDQIAAAVEHLVSEGLSPEGKAEFLTALALKGETIEEIAGFARELREKSVRPALIGDLSGRVILDVCGTGGDKLNTFNISTTVAIVAASQGLAVAKHGNRAITSQSGSADVLEALGIPIDLEPSDAVESLHVHNFAFFFAPKYHPAFKNIGPARRLCAERGQRTIFNFLGPLLNPVRPTAQLIGVPRRELCEPLARVLQSLGIQRGMVVSGSVTGSGSPDVFLDELSTLGENHISEFYQGRGFNSSVLGIGDFPLQPATLSDLSGGDRQANAAIIRALLAGRDRGPRRDAVLLNAAAAFLVADQVKSLQEGWVLSERAIDSGSAMAKIDELARQ
jgi:anthranilate phosphoribosyltransferase